MYDDEQTIAHFVGRNGGSSEGFGIDAALDFPLFYKLPPIAKGEIDVADMRRIFAQRKARERDLLSSHGEAGRYFVSFLDNHDQHERLKHPLTPDDPGDARHRVAVHAAGDPVRVPRHRAGTGRYDRPGRRADLNSNESTREALWGNPSPSRRAPDVRAIRALASLRDDEPAIRYGRLYFREVSG